MPAVCLKTSVIAALVAAAWTLAGCAGSTTAGGAATSASPSALSASSSSRATPSGSASPAASATASPTQESVSIAVKIRDGQVDPNGERIDVTAGQKVTLRVTSDVDEEIHAHAVGDGFQLDVSPGKTATGSFVATDPGRFVIEAHHLEKVIVILNVR